MRLIDEQYTRTPFYGIRRMTAGLKGQRHQVNHERVARLLGTMGLVTIYPRPRGSQPSPEHRVYAYLPRGVAIERPDQVWSTDITYIPFRPPAPRGDNMRGAATRPPLSDSSLRIRD